MSVKDAMLAILTLGPAYGSQLHAELTARTPHRSPVNVGQIYTTIDRLAKQRLIESAGATDDGLPLHALTPAGRERAREWMTVADGALDWTEMLDQVIVGATVDEDSSRRLVDSYRALWRSRREEHSGIAVPEARIAQMALDRLAGAALDWLEEVEDILHQEVVARPLTEGRPRRGRPLSPAAETAT